MLIDIYLHEQKSGVTPLTGNFVMTMNIELRLDKDVTVLKEMIKLVSVASVRMAYKVCQAGDYGQAWIGWRLLFI